MNAYIDQVVYGNRKAQLELQELYTEIKWLRAEIEALRKRIDRLDALEDWLADRVGPLVLIDDVYTALAAGRDGP